MFHVKHWKEEEIIYSVKIYRLRLDLDKFEEKYFLGCASLFKNEYEIIYSNNFSDLVSATETYNNIKCSYLTEENNKVVIEEKYIFNEFSEVIKFKGIGDFMI